MFWFTPDGNDDTPQNFNDGDVPTWNAATARWEAQPGGGSGNQTWAEVLAEGNESGDNTPTIVSGQALAFTDNIDDSVQGIIEYTTGDGLILRTEDTDTEFGDSKVSLLAGSTPEVSGANIQVYNGSSAGNVTISAGNGLAEDISGGNVSITSGDHGGGETGSGGNINLLAGSGVDDGNAGIIEITGGSSDVGLGGQVSLVGGNSTDGDGGGIEISSGNSDTASAGDINLLGGTGQAGGDISITGGDGNLADAPGGDITITGGAGQGGEQGDGGNVTITPGAPSGEILLNQEDDANAIRIFGTGLTNPAIVINSNGLGFFDGTPVTRPVVADATALLVALDAMGFITYTP